MSLPGRRLVLLRHGRTAWNAVGRGQGHHDVELDDAGHDQASAAARWVAAYRPSALWSSDLARAGQTTAYVAKETGLEPVYDARLREYHLGDRTGLTMAEFEERFPEAYASFLDGRFEAVPGGEDTAEVRERVHAALTELLGALGAGETALVVSHGGSLRVGIAALLGWTEEQTGSLQGLGNCSWAVLEEVARGGRLRMAGYNLRA